MANINLKNIVISSAIIFGGLVSSVAFAQENTPYTQIAWGNDSIDTPSGDDGTAYPNGSITGIGSEDRTGADAPVSPTEER